MADHLRVLIIDDSQDDVGLIVRELESGGYKVTHERVATRQMMETALEQKTWDVIISNFQMRTFTGLEALKLLEEKGLGLPFIIVSDTMSEEIALQCLKAGIHAFFKKKNIKLLIPAVERGLREVTIQREHKQAEERLRASEEKYRMLVESSTDAISVMDKERKVVSCNQAFYKLFAYDKEELKGKSARIFHPTDESFNAFGELVFPVLQKTGSFRTEMDCMRKDGTAFPTEMVLSVLKSTDGSVNGYVNIVRDITERKRAEEALKNAKEASEFARGELELINQQLEVSKKNAEAANVAKSNFLARMSHEIRTPMNSVIGFTDMLLDTKLSEEQIDFARTVKRSAEALLSLIDEVLDFSKIEAGKMELEAIDFDPEILAYDVCDIIRPRIGEKRVELLCRIGDDVPARVKGDPGRIRQVLVNLMGNATKFTERGEIELFLDLAEEQGDRLKLYGFVRDTGIGVPKEKIDIIFYPFQQADGSTTRRFGGTGLGLSITKQLINLMDGDVWVESEPDKGSFFHFTVWLDKSMRAAGRKDDLS